MTIDPDAQDAVFLPDFSARLGAGTHLVRLEERGGGDLPYSISVRFNALTPHSSPQCQVGLQTSLAAPAVAEGRARRGHPRRCRTAATRSSPRWSRWWASRAGWSLATTSLKELVKRGAIDAYEVRGREVVLYWRGMDAGAAASVPISLIAAVPAATPRPRAARTSTTRTSTRVGSRALCRGDGQGRLVLPDQIRDGPRGGVAGSKGACRVDMRRDDAVAPVEAGDGHQAASIWSGGKSALRSARNAWATPASVTWCRKPNQVLPS